LQISKNVEGLNEPTYQAALYDKSPAEASITISKLQGYLKKKEMPQEVLEGVKVVKKLGK
jgi:hypothetical protein